MAIDPATGKEAEVKEETTLLDEGAAETAQTPEEKIAADKVAQETEEKRILEADPATLNDKEKGTRAALEKTAAEKKLIETPDDQLTPEKKTEKAALIKARDDAAKAAKGAPEKYADFTVPEGIEVDAPMLEEFKTVAKEQNLTQAGAQKLVDLQVKHVQKIADSLLDEFNQTVRAWKAETMAGLGADSKKQLTYAGRALERFGTPELRAILKSTGVANHKEMVKFCIKVGKTVSEDTIVDGKNKTGAKSDGELFYGNTMA